MNNPTEWINTRIDDFNQKYQTADLHEFNSFLLHLIRDTMDCAMTAKRQVDLLTGALAELTRNGTSPQAHRAFDVKSLTSRPKNRPNEHEAPSSKQRQARSRRKSRKI